MKKSKFQMLDNYIKLYSLKTERRILPDDKNCIVEVNIAGKILKIQEKEKKIYGEIELLEKLKIKPKSKEEEIATINLIIGGVFYSTIENKKDFEKLLKENGIATLSQIARSYIIANTALSGMPTIDIPLINFLEDEK